MMWVDKLKVHVNDQGVKLFTLTNIWTTEEEKCLASCFSAEN